MQSRFLELRETSLTKAVMKSVAKIRLVLNAETICLKFTTLSKLNRRRRRTMF